jgi:hypothetical protein
MKGIGGDKCTSCLHEQCNSWMCPYNNTEDIPGTEIHRADLTKAELEALMTKWTFFMHEGELVKAEKILDEICDKVGVST